MLEFSIVDESVGYSAFKNYVEEAYTAEANLPFYEWNFVAAPSGGRLILIEDGCEVIGGCHLVLPFDGPFVCFSRTVSPIDLLPDWCKLRALGSVGELSSFFVLRGQSRSRIMLAFIVEFRRICESLGISHVLILGGLRLGTYRVYHSAGWRLVGPPICDRLWRLNEQDVSQNVVPMLAPVTDLGKVSFVEPKASEWIRANMMPDGLFEAATG